MSATRRGDADLAQHVHDGALIEKRLSHGGDNAAFQLAGGQTPCMRGVLRSLSEESARHIVPIASPILHGMARRQWIAFLIE